MAFSRSCILVFYKNNLYDIIKKKGGNKNERFKNNKKDNNSK